MNASHMMHEMIIHSTLLHGIVHWLDLIGIVVLVGGFAFRHLVWPAHHPPEEALHRRHALIAAGCLSLLVITGCADLVLRTQMMTKKPIMEFFSVLPVVLFKTHFGLVWIWKMSLLCLFWALLFLEERKASSHKGLSLLFSALLCLTVSLSGHAADRGDLSLAVLNDWLHLLSVSVWIGGLIYLTFSAPSPLPDRQAGGLLGEVLRRFSRVAVVCVVILFISGLYSAFLYIDTFGDLVTVPYGQVLLLKITLVLPVLGLGALSRSYILPGLCRTEPQTVGRLLLCLVPKAFRTRPLPQQFLLFITVEFLLAILVLFCAALLTQLPPPHRMPQP